MRLIFWSRLTLNTLYHDRIFKVNARSRSIRIRAGANLYLFSEIKVMVISQVQNKGINEMWNTV